MLRVTLPCKQKLRAPVSQTSHRAPVISEAHISREVVSSTRRVEDLFFKTLPQALNIFSRGVRTNAKEDAERYHREQYPKINEMLSHLLDTAPVIRTFDVHTSTTHRVAAGKAA